MFTVLMPPGVNAIAVSKHIYIIYHIILYHIIYIVSYDYITTLHCCLHLHTEEWIYFSIYA
jgi:hypothetical protein